MKIINCRSGLSALVGIVLLNLSLPLFGANPSPCPRFPVGSRIQEPVDLFSSGGTLTVALQYQTMMDEHGSTRFCFTTMDGKQSPTLHVNPGDRLVLTITNLVPADAPGLPAMQMHSHSMDMELSSADHSLICGAANMTPSSVNVHYHGTNISPTCHSDEVIRTMVNSGETFTYNITFPTDEPPGLYWYHPHIHGISEAAVQGGATGAIIVEGIEKIQPAVANLPQRLLMVRDNPLPGADDKKADSSDEEPAWDLSLNYVPVPFPKYTPSIIPIRAKEKQFWRLANTAAGTILEVALTYDGVPQTLNLVGLDGVPVGSQDGTRQGKLLAVKHLRIPPAGRAEFIITGPSADVKDALLVTQNVDTGPDGDVDPFRPIARLKVENAATDVARLPRATSDVISAFRSTPQRFEGLESAAATMRRKLYFSEDNPDGKFFITVDGENPKLFDPDAPPAIVTTQGSVEDWVIENRALENHEFHIHQIHFLLMAVNGVPVPANKRQFLDMVDIPFWSGTGQYPSVTVRMDFRGPDVGDFVYHCHILEHEDKGMMQIIRVMPKK
jgi:FtsP/CotA-like multicopper oxidase with cupredoxin domain